MRDNNARPDMRSWLETRHQSELALARRATHEKAARAHRELAKLYEAELNRAIDWAAVMRIGKAARQTPVHGK